MNTAALIGAAIAAAVALTAAAVWGKRSRLERARQLPPRSFLTSAEIHSQYYAGEIPAAVVGQAVERIGKILGVDPRLLRPEDRFDETLRPPKGWEFDDGLTALTEELLARSEKAQVPVDIQSIKTVDDYVKLEFRIAATKP